MSDSSGASQRVALGDCVFDLATGELTAAEADGAARTERLAPQPARLLALLIANSGQLVSREDIRRAIWPDDHVEFDQALHFCVRQIRAALGESAAQPRYIETLPRRGYRLMVEPRPFAGDFPQSTQRTPTAAVAAGGTRRAGVATVALALLLVVVLAQLWRAPVVAAARDERMRIAIMPFAPPAGWSGTADAGPIADHLLAILGADARFAVIGPTTTSAMTAQPLTETARQTRVAFLINGRYITHEQRPHVLAELIRAADGAHVWVAPFDIAADPAVSASRIASAVVSRLAGDE